MTSRLAIPALLLLILVWQKATCQIAIYGDTRSEPQIHQQIIAELTDHHPRLCIHTGDLNSKGLSQQEYDYFFSIVKPLSDICSFHAVKGNHEKSLSLFLENFPAFGTKSYGKIEHEGLAIYLLDSTAELSPGSEQYKWLSSAMTDSLPGIVVLHHPIFSSGEHGSDTELMMYFPQLLQKGRIVAVFSGHDHNYERSEYQGIKYIVTAGGGSPQRTGRSPNPYSEVFEITHHYLLLTKVPEGWKAEVWDLHDRLIDSFTLDTK